MAPEAIEARPKSTKQNQKSSPNSLEKNQTSAKIRFYHTFNTKTKSQEPQTSGFRFTNLFQTWHGNKPRNKTGCLALAAREKTLEMKIPTPEIGKHPIHDHHVSFLLLPKSPRVPARYQNGNPSTNMEAPSPASHNSGHRKLLPHPVSELKMLWKLTPEASEPAHI